MFNKVISIILVLLMGASVAFGVVNYVGQQNITKLMNENFGGQDDLAQEDDVTIASEYVIKSTRQISDAYISGDTSALSDEDKETLDLAKAVLDSKITKDMSDYDKELAIYKYLIKELKFDAGVLSVVPMTYEGSDAPHGVLKTKNAICVGYATTFRLLMQMMGFECMVVHNTELTHSWNLIKLDGEWYHVDCYSDVNSDGFGNFNLNDEMASAGHDWNKEFFPAATGIKYNPAVRDCVEIEDIYAIPKFVHDSVEEGKAYFSCSFKENLTEENEKVAAYIANKVVDAINMDENGFYNLIWTKNENNEYIMCLFYSKFYEDDIELDEETQAKADEAIAEYYDVMMFDEGMSGEGMYEYGCDVDIIKPKG